MLLMVFESLDPVECVLSHKCIFSLRRKRKATERTRRTRREEEEER
jgi:hypothetical protein